MNARITFLAAACALAVAACGEKSPNTSAHTAPLAGSTDPAPAANPAPADAVVAAPAAVAQGSDKSAAVVADCATEIEGTDAMQYNVESIVVPASCTEFKITLKHTGQMPVAAMGHNVVIAKTADMQAVVADGMGAGAAAAYVKPSDARIIAHTEMIGGGQTTSVIVPVSKIQGDGPYEFFCSFPGHSAIMKGTIAVK